jgi:hypothetical protein
MLLRDPRVFAFVLIAFGVGLLGWYGPKWYALPDWSDAEITQSVELNLALDLQHRGPLLQPTGERLEELRRTVRAEVVGEIKRERDELERWLGAGLVLCVFGAGSLVLSLANRRPGTRP